MKIPMELQTIRELLQPSLVDILLLLNDQEKTESQIASLLEKDTPEIQHALEQLIKQGLVRSRENNRGEPLYETTPEGRRLFDIKGYHVALVLGLFAFILYSLGLILVINCYSNPIYGVSILKPFQDEVLLQQFIIGCVLVTGGTVAGSIATYKVMHD